MKLIHVSGSYVGALELIFEMELDPCLVQNYIMLELYGKIFQYDCMCVVVIAL
jgi:hypothetical protein